MQAIHFYTSLLQKYPLTTKCVTAGLLGVGGDVVCQLYVEHKQNIDVSRILRMGSHGLFFTAPILHLWYGVLDKFVPEVPSVAEAAQKAGKFQHYAYKFKIAGKKLFLDQVFVAPIIILSFFCWATAVQSLQEGRFQSAPLLVSEIKQKMEKELLNALQMNYAIWPVAQIFNFSVVPPIYRVLFANIVSLLWNTYLSFVQHREPSLTESTPSLPAAVSPANDKV